jgi:uncharacterized protein (DUF2141 family)
LRRVSVLALAAMLTTAPAFAGDLTVTFAGLRSDKGKLSAALYSEKDAWPDGKASVEVDIPPREGEIRYTFKNVSPGRHAISAFHDENANGKFDTTFIGLPKEGFAFSNDAKPGLSSPSFDTAAFTVGDGPAVLTIHLDYWASTR